MFHRPLKLLFAAKVQAMPPDCYTIMIPRPVSIEICRIKLLKPVGFANFGDLFKPLRNAAVIQKLTAILLLMVFTIGSAPKAYFHDLVADHVDRNGCSEDHQSAVFHQHETNCDFDDLVVPSVFVEPTVATATLLSLCNDRFFSIYITSGSFSFFQHQENRGPPAA